MKKRVIFLGILILFKIPFLFAADEKKVTLTTYYPAPYGEYKTLKASESITVTGPSGANEKAVLSAGGSSGTGLVVTNENKVGIGTTSPKGILDLASTKQAFFPPQVTTSQRNAIASVTTAEASKKGAVVYNTDTNTLETYDGNKNWKGVSGGGLVWKTVTKGADRFPQLSWSNYISQKPTGACICSDNNSPSSAGYKFAGYLSSHSDDKTRFITCDEDTYDRCEKQYMHYLVPE